MLEIGHIMLRMVDGLDQVPVSCSLARYKYYRYIEGLKADILIDTCLDVRAESRAGSESPLSSFRILQSWLCYDNSSNQNFFVLPNA